LILNAKQVSKIYIPFINIGKDRCIPRMAASGTSMMSIRCVILPSSNRVVQMSRPWDMQLLSQERPATA
jgi:hypothetical protein